MAAQCCEHFRQAKLYTVEPDGLDDTARSLARDPSQLF